jgi:hypothetical protein
MLVICALLFAGAIQVAFAFRRFQRIFYRLVLRIPISMACLYLYALAIFIEGCFDNIARFRGNQLHKEEPGPWVGPRRSRKPIAPRVHWEVSNSCLKWCQNSRRLATQ